MYSTQAFRVIIQMTSVNITTMPIFNVNSKDVKATLEEK
jgi:hypothetical protein